MGRRRHSGATQRAPDERYRRFDGIALDELPLVPLRAAAEVASHRVDRVPAPQLWKPRRATAVLDRVGRAGEVDPPDASAL